LGPIVKYASGPQKGQLVASDIEKWFQEDKYQGNPGIVAQWASIHSTLAANWVKADPLNAANVVEWQTSHPDDVAQWKKDNPSIPEPKTEELAGAFFQSLSKEHPGKFPALVQPDGSADKKMELVDQGSDIQSIFFDLWRQDHADVDLEKVPADMVMASGSGLDPDITIMNAYFQLDRVANKWAEMTKGDAAEIRKNMVQMLNDKASAPLGGLVGVPLINVLEINLAIKEQYSPLIKTAAR
jgi:K+-transporting ATPase ATPase C chain